jgi:hypothetical protein
MTTVMLELGDRWADGHGMYEEIHIEVPSLFTIEELRNNFKSAEKEFGVKAREFASGYQDSQVKRDDLQPLVDAGFKFSETTEAGAYFEDGEYIDEDYIYLGVEDLTEILMFLYGYGLEGFKWKVIEKPPVLNQESYGYGLFSL